MEIKVESLPAIEGGKAVRENFLPFSQPEIREEDVDAVADVLRSRWIGTGPRCQEFEERFAGYLGSKYCVSVNSCTAALILALKRLGLDEKAEVITTPLTFCATVGAIIEAGYKPVLCDVDPETGCIEPGEVEKKVTRKTRAILPVHFAGYPCEMNDLSVIAEGYDLQIVEDCAHAIETTYHGKHAGTWGRAGCFSFYANKNLTTAEGGMISTESKEDAEWYRSMRSHGMRGDAWKRYSKHGYKHYLVEELGYKCNMPDMAAALGLKQLERIEEHWETRYRIWRRYDEGLKDLPIIPPSLPEEGMRSGLHLYIIRIKPDALKVGRDHIVSALQKEGIGVGVHYLIVPEHPGFMERLGTRPEEYPNAFRFGRTCISLPLSPAMTDKDALDVIQAVRKVIEYYRR